MTNLDKQPRPRRFLAPVLGALALVAAGAVLYGTVAPAGKAASDCPADSAKLAARLAPLAKGELAALQVASEPRRAVQIAFQRDDGGKLTVADFKGRAVLLNLWATWCIPCRKEMPALDALQGKLGSPQFEVVAVNIDTRNLDKPKTWLNDVGVGHLAYYSDPNAKVFQDLKVVGKAIGMPTTLLIDPNGCEIASLSGPAEWASADGLKLINAALGR